MHKNFMLLIYLLASLIIVAAFAQSLNILFLSQNTPSAPEQEVVVLKDDTGMLKYASGTCEINQDCIVTGCSAELCASENLFSTCEVKADAPSMEEYSCGCYQGLCAWTEK